jgi:hypothetical protein
MTKLQQIQDLIDQWSNQGTTIGGKGFQPQQLEQLLDELEEKLDDDSEPNFLAEGYGPLAQVIYNQLTESLLYPDQVPLDPVRFFKDFSARLAKILSLLFEGKIDELENGPKSECSDNDK